MHLPPGEKCVLDGFTNEDSMEEIVEFDGSASLRLPDGWHAINWRRIDQQVRTMQIRIAKATQKGDWPGESPATVADPLVLRQGTGGATSD